MYKAVLKNIYVVLLALILVFSLQISAFAAEPADHAPKGNIAASSTLIDRSTYTDGSLYENAPVKDEPVKIGIKYDYEAVSYAEFYCASGAFSIGFYDTERSYTELCTQNYSMLCTMRASAYSSPWHVLMDETYTGYEPAAAAAASYGGFVGYIDHEYRVLYGSYATEGTANRVSRRYSLPGKAYSSSSTGVFVISESGRKLLLFDCSECAVALRPQDTSNSLCEYDGRKYYGAFECRPYDSYAMTIINVVSLEDYVKGVIPYEMSPSWPHEALKAQAVCARTYVVYNRDEYAEYGFDITDDTMSQVYRGTDGADERTDSAVEETAGQFVRYKGEICDIYYFASSGGATEDGANVYDADYPYLTGRIDPFEKAVNFTGKTWTSYRSGDQISYYLARAGYEIGTVTKIDYVYSVLGNVIGATYYDDHGKTVSLTGRDSYALLYLSNCRFTVEKVWDEFVFNGTGWGHNCGMSQWGAYAMADVYGYNYDDIIRFYYIGAYVA